MKRSDCAAVCFCVALALFYTITGPRPAPAAVSSGASQVHVYLLRGFMNVFSPGIDSLATEIGNRGIPVSVNNHLLWPGFADTAIENYRAGKEKTIIVIGHSLGASAAAAMAERLGQAGIPVSLLVTFDPVTRPTIPANVRRAINFYDSSGIGTPAQKASNSHGAFANVDREDLNHVSITTAPDLHAKVLSYVMEAIRSSGGSAPAAQRSRQHNAVAPESARGAAVTGGVQ